MSYRENGSREKPTMVKISAVIIALNEEQNIQRALDSLSFCDEIIVVDSGSSDSTLQICQAAGAKVEQVEWRGYVDTKNYAASLAAGDWILSLDADEEVTDELRLELLEIASRTTAADGYRVPRKNHYLGRWIRHCGWYPDYQMRFWKSGKGKWQGGSVHESVTVDGQISQTKAALNHFTYASINEHLDRIKNYAGLHAADKYKAGKRVGYLTILLAAPFMFIKTYILRLGFLDGLHGLLVSAIGSFYYLLKKVRLWELQQQNKEKK
jgi:glycosyltransferase involved in cell wall biosynthesis